MEEMHRFFIHILYATLFGVCCCYSWGTLRAIHTCTRDRINKTAEWQTESACLSSGNCEMNEFHRAHTHMLATWTLSKTYTHVSSSIELACCRLTVNGACVCLKFFPRLLYSLYTFVTTFARSLACFHFSSSSLFNGSSMAFFLLHFVTSPFHYSFLFLFLFLFASRFHFLFVICIEPFGCSRSVYNTQHTFCGIFFIISFALPVSVCCCGFCCSSLHVKSLHW